MIMAEWHSTLRRSARVASLVFRTSAFALIVIPCGLALWGQAAAHVVDADHVDRRGIWTASFHIESSAWRLGIRLDFLVTKDHATDIQSGVVFRDVAYQNRQLFRLADVLGPRPFRFERHVVIGRIVVLEEGYFARRLPQKYYRMAFGAHGLPIIANRYEVNISYCAVFLLAVPAIWLPRLLRGRLPVPGFDVVRKHDTGNANRGEEENRDENAKVGR